MYLRRRISDNYSGTVMCVYRLKTVPPFFTAHMFCASRAGPRYSSFLRNFPTNLNVFLRGL